MGDFSRSFKWAGFLLGFALGGFFDGILLHQVLQWHHLLSNVQSAALQDLRAQVLADGLFHTLMYVLAAIALVLLWKRRVEYAAVGADVQLWSLALIGFGTWHIVDSILSHWVLGIHRIRVDSPNPLFWDLLWFFAFGVAPAVAGWLLRRRGPGAPGRGRRAAAALAVAAIVAAPIAALPPEGSEEVLVLFGPGTRPAQAFNALAQADARVQWVDPSGGLWAVKLADRAQSRQLYTQGAWLVSSAPVGLGCFSWSSVAR